MARTLAGAGLASACRSVASEADFRQQLGGDIDLVLFDDRVPWFDVFDALRAIQEHGDIPLVLQCDPAAEPAALEAMRRGAADYVYRDRPGRLVFAARQALARRGAAHRRPAPRGGRTGRWWVEIAESVDVVVYLAEAPGGRILYLSPPFERIWGRPVAGARSESFAWADTVHPDDREKYLAAAARAPFGQGFSLEYRILDAGGAVRWIHERRFAVRAGRGRSPRFAGMARDITEDKKADDALRASEQSFRAVFDQAAVGVVQTEVATGRFIKVNRRFCQITGRSRQELGQLTYMAITHPDYAADDQKYIEQLKTGAIREYSREKRYLRKDGSEVWVQLTVSPMWTPGEKPDYCIVIAQDITQRKRLEEQMAQAQKMEAIGKMAGGIAHDFNNILAAINGYAQLADLTLEENPTARHHLGAVLQASGRAADLVRQILALSRHQPLQRRPTALAPVMAESLKLLRATIPATIEFEVSLAPDTPVVLADSTQLHQILMNLGLNAAHAMKEGPGRLQVGLKPWVIGRRKVAGAPRLAPGRYARLSVRDTGHGMDKATLRKIFEPFFTTKPEGEGTGLGLAVVQGIMNSYEGAATVASTPGEGTTFDLYFPAHEGEAAPDAPKDRPIPRGQGQKILFVDDEELLARLAHEVLTGLGYQVEFATRPDRALALVREDPLRFDLVFTDQTMPGMTGLALAAGLRQLRPALPVILMTGSSLALTTEHLEAAGIRQLLPKPATLCSLGLAAHAALARPNPS
jgi:PAS domain S-box-containing protein